MFKLESYITPVILSYVEKYVKNFKPEQSQVSLWGGDASFQNLDLRLEVLEGQLNLPFKFVSGHIHELLIHIPWMKIKSEPIVITINTIECILKLKDENRTECNTNLLLNNKKIEQEEAPPGYIKSIVTKVINNITIHCNNLILKYVEEDIVLSVNVRFLSMQTVNNKWEPAFSDVNGIEVMLRKIITINDLTLCLDKMDASGKIETYQDPVLYRCSMVLRMIMNYNNLSKKASVTRLDLHCKKMEFSMTEQQVPMLRRLIALISALQNKNFPITKETSMVTSEDREISNQDDTNQSTGTTNESVGWGGWAWNTVLSMLPTDWDDWSNEQQLTHNGHVIHLGIFVDDATVTFKTIESIKEQLFYKTRKQRYKSFLSLRLNCVVMDILSQGIAKTFFQMGVASIRLFPKGECSCGHPEVVEGVQPPLYLAAGKYNLDYLKDTLFDEDAIENQGMKRDYKNGIHDYLNLMTIEKLLGRCPALVMDYVHFVDLPDDVTLDSLSEINSNIDQTNYNEHRVVRYAIGDFTLRLCSGLFHRIETIKNAAAKYDYNPYIIIKPDPSLEELSPVTLEEYEALRENVSMVETKFYFVNVSLQLQIADHDIMGLPQLQKSLENRPISSTPAFTDNPYVSIECDQTIISVIEPLYPFKLVACASRQTELAENMFEQCHRFVTVEVNGMKSQLYLTISCHTFIITPFSTNCLIKTLLYPQYWQDIKLIQNLYCVKSDSITITGTKAQCMTVISIINSVLNPTDVSNPLVCSSLLSDVCIEKDAIYLELLLENITCKSLLSRSVISSGVNLGALKVFVLNNTQQSFILSGPEVEINSKESENNSLLEVIAQFPRKISKQTHPPIISFQVAEIRSSLDPLFFQWLEYKINYYHFNAISIAQTDSHQPIVEGTLSDTGTRKKTFPSLHESVHSVSDKEKRKSVGTSEKPKLFGIDEIQRNTLKNENEIELQNVQKSKLVSKLAEFHPWWCGLILNGSIGHIVIYIPSMTMSGIGVDGIESAKNNAVKTHSDLQILVIKMPSLIIHSSNMNSELLASYFNELPIKLPETIWMQQTQSFPWSLNCKEFYCYTIRQNIQHSFIKKLSLNATVALTTKNNSNESTGNLLTSLGLCVHIDNSPIVISISEEQVLFISNILSHVLNALQLKSVINENSPIVLQNNNETQFVLPIIPQTPSTPTQLLYTEDTTTTSSVSLSKDDNRQEKDSIVLTAWIQWTITKVSLKLYIIGQENQSSHKLALELEDIITSVDLQPVYLKIKNKITTATIFNYVKAPNAQQWDFGEYVGLVLCGKEDTSQKSDDLGFLNFTLTRARSGNVHTRWGAYKRHKKKVPSVTDSILTTDGYISEILVKLQMVDVILPLNVLSKYIQIIKPLSEIHKTNEPFTTNGDNGNSNLSLNCITKLNNETMPLLYLEFKGFRIMIPVENKPELTLQHDLFMIQLESISISPHAENPICRTPLRQDIYQLAAQANILNIPGSAVEDRQYQINIKGISSYTTTWKNYQISINKRMSQSYLYTMNENPALEWNKLGNGNSLEPRFSTVPIITRLDISLIIAPAIIFKPDTIVCGSAMELNCLTDIEIMLNLDQLKLISVLNDEFKNILLDNYNYINENNSPINTECNFTNLPTDTKRNIHKTYQTSQESEIDFTKDSGIDFEMSSLNSTIIGKASETALPPFEFLVNCGKISIILYETQCISSNLNLSANELYEEDYSDVKNPLAFVTINQPNAYFLQQHLKQKIQISCFDFTVALGNENICDLVSIPKESDFKMYMIETKGGEPHPDTGIPPSFITVKCEKNPGKNFNISVEMGRPTKFYFSLSRLRQIENIHNKVLSCLVNENSEQDVENVSPCIINPAMVDKKPVFPDVNFSTQQLVISLITEIDSEIVTSVAAIKSNISTFTRLDRIYSTVFIDSLIISVIFNQKRKILLNPWCCNFTVYLLWESWQENVSIPQIQLQADSHSIHLDIGPEQIKIIQTVVKDVELLLTKLSSNNTRTDASQTPVHLPTEQHYKDDLKAGAFQFIDGSGEELPFPYQVVFFNYPQQAMAWRYPQPRALTKIHISPVPFETLDDDDIYIRKIQCVLEYWSDSHMAYQHYADFNLSETDCCRLDLPQTAPNRAVACVWRVSLLPNICQRKGKTLVSTRALAVCLRIDSYFNSAIIPNIQAALNISAIYISLYNHINPVVYNNLQSPLKGYSLKDTIPEVQCFMTIEHKTAVFVLNKWIDGTSLIDVSGTISVHILDYGYLIMQEVLDSLNGKLQVSISDKVDVSFVSKPFAFKFSPAVAHALAISAHLWSSALDAEENKKAIILTRYVIANNCDRQIRFSQSGTNDSILLNSKQCSFYSWRYIGNQMLRVSTELHGWSWSLTIPVNKDGLQVVEFGNNVSNVVLFADIVSLSATQKLITFSGQLIISNQLTDNFDLRLVKYESEQGFKAIPSKNIYLVQSCSHPPSIVLENDKRMAIRLRFSSIANLSWTGDIPLQPNVKSDQPWLVKVPLQERGQFLSIWVRIVTQVIKGRMKVLAIFSPLYMLRSYLPVPVNVQVDTPSLKTSMKTTVNGRGKKQQLYCPGTFEHFHQLTFQLDFGISASNPYVPLSYTSVDQRKFFKRPEIEDIDAILKELENQTEENKWPFQTDDIDEWIPAEQPHTHVQVKYQDAKLTSSTLLLELQPWCFVLNSMGCHLSLVSEDVELCQIPHYGIVTPPKLDNTFHIGIAISDTYYTSRSLQLANPDWSQSFYMPRIEGIIPLEGNVTTYVDCDASISILHISSNMHEDMRFLRINSSHILCNLTNQELCVATLAIDEASSRVDLPADLTPFSFNVTPTDNQKQGSPVIQWHTIQADGNIQRAALYISLSLGYRWSCPVRVDQNLSRRCIVVPNGSKTVPVVITTQDDKGIIYLMVHKDKYPQLHVKNSCPFKIAIAQSNESDGIVLDAPHFSWLCEIEENTSSYYSLPFYSSRLPDSPSSNTSNILVIAISSFNNINQEVKKNDLKWSRGINLATVTSSLIEQYVRLPFHGDVKITMQNRCYTTYVNILPISQVEVSARDIRSRLLRKENKSKELEVLYDKVDSTEENKSSSNVQNLLSSSASETSFFSAQEDTMDSPRTQANFEGTFNQDNFDFDVNLKSKDVEVSKRTNVKEGSVTVYLQGMTMTISSDINENAQQKEIANLSITDLVIVTDAKSNHFNLSICLGDLQLDNQMFDQGGFDFPVVLISQNPVTKKEKSSINDCTVSNISKIRENSLIAVDYTCEFDEQVTGHKDFRLKISPVSAYIEDTFVSQLLDYATTMVPPCFVISPKREKKVATIDSVYIPDYILIDAKILSAPLRLQNFIIEPVSILLSVHTSVRLYVALDHSPLYFSTFERKYLLTTPYRLGNSLTMHYLSGAIFGAGWVVGSLEILGSPGGLAQALGSGLRDFISLPFQGLLQGPWGFIVGITHGSASLMKHVTAGTVNSVTKLASSVARNLDRLTLDEEHLQRQEESRRIRPRGMAQGLYQGLSSLGMSLLAAVAGLAHHPLQQVWSGEATPKGLVTGVSLGLVGVVTKPLSGAAELVALTGQGLLQGAGWNSLPSPRQRSITQYSSNNNNAFFRYAWRLLPILEDRNDSILYVTTADYVVHQGSNRPVTLILTHQALLLVNTVEDTVERIVSLKEITSIDHPSDSTLLCLYCPPISNQTNEPVSPVEYEMDQQMRARVAAYVRTSSTGLASVSSNSDDETDAFENTTQNLEHTLTFFIDSDSRNYLLSLFNIAKRQIRGNGFIVL